MVGNAIYPAILTYVGENLAGKITGMVIDEAVVNLEQMMKDQLYFNKNINEAFNLLTNNNISAVQQPK